VTKQERDELRRAVADYIQTEGCSCCGDYDQHQKDAERLGRLLRVRRYPDGSGRNFALYRTRKP
jgi:hypothetical protein